MRWPKMCFLISFFFVLSGIFQAESRRAQWGDNYFVQGTISVPYAEIVEPFSAWYDGQNGASRIDYYGGMVKTYQLKKEMPYGSSYKVAPVTDENNLNINRCLQVNGSKKSQIEPQQVLPDLSNYKLIGHTVLNATNVEKWQLIILMDRGDKNSTYTMYVTSMEGTKSNSVRKNGVPVRFEMQGYNTLLGSHYDHYYIDYLEYRTDPISSNIFTVTEGLPCSAFPGPGAQMEFNMNPMCQFMNAKKSYNLAKKLFHWFKWEHKKTYKSKREHAKRHFELFHNHMFIESKNRANLGYRLKLNHLADRSKEELKMMRGRLHSKGYNGGLPFEYSKEDVSTIINDTFDWRLAGAVTPVKDQSFCGSCWSFGTVGEIEGAYFVKYGKLVRFSEQALVDCSWGYGNNGCNGGEDFRSYQWILKHGGLPTNEQYGSYLGADSYCHIANMTLIGAIDKYFNVTPNDPNALRLALIKNGPVSVSIDASPRSFTFYSHGVYYDPDCKNKEDELDHAVLLVGYGSLNGQMYWLIKNSWSTYWGNDGYILISTKDNNCGVMTAPTFVQLK